MTFVWKEKLFIELNCFLSPSNLVAEINILELLILFFHSNRLFFVVPNCPFVQFFSYCYRSQEQNGSVLV